MSRMDRKNLVYIFLVTFLAVGSFFYFRSNTHDCVVTVISGTSSAGKSTYAAKIKKQSNKKACIVALDDFISQIVTQKAIALGWREEDAQGPWEFIKKYVIKKTGKYVFDYEIRTQWLSYQLFYDAIVKACAGCEEVIVDTIIESQQQYDDLMNILKTKTVRKVLLYCPLQVIAQRIKNRADMASFSGLGISLATYESFMAMYSSDQPDKQNQPVDTIQLTEVKKILNESIEIMLQTQGDEDFVEAKQYAYNLLQRFTRHFMERGASGVVKIYSAFAFDEIISSSQAS
ncbi:hypothetical protein FJ366_01995 [Candidatus Dependentiae bacterium]|nr:hypothetical protein [Candidatus Dependentiae bacterium]